MGKQKQLAGNTRKARRVEAITRAELAKTRVELVKTRREQAKTRAELVKTRAEQTKTRSELAKTRKSKTALPTRQVEATLRHVFRKEFNLRQKMSGSPVKQSRMPGRVDLLGRLSIRQREILQLISESQNTKQIADILRISTKTVEYHRRKLMAALNVYDVPGLVRFAMYSGVVPPEK